MRKRIAVAVIMIAGVAAVAAGATPPAKLVVSEGFRNPIGFYDSTPTLSWQLPAGTGAQAAYQVVVASDAGSLGQAPDLWDSGKVTTDQSVWVPYAGKPLGPRQRAFWKVKFWDQDERESSWSAPATFELGLLSNSDWKGKWIRMAPPPMTDTRTPSTPRKIVITKALYGLPGKPGQQVDLAEKLQRQVAAGDYRVRASNAFAGRDPASGIVKTLVLEYSVDGKAEKTTVRENGALNLSTGERLVSTGKGERFVPEYLRREFDAASKVQSARLYVTARGLYEIYLNGNKVGEDYMVPGWTPYHRRIETLTYDVTGMVRKGANAIGAILGEGWYAGEMMRKRFVYPQARPALLLQLEITGTDGATQTIVTDEAWKATDRGPIRYASIYHGEIYDAAMEMPGWNAAGFDDAAWNGVVREEIANEPLLVPKRHYPTRATEELKTRRITEPEPGRLVFDLGQNMVGWPRLEIPVEAGGTVTVRVAEMLQKNGTLYTANYRAARSTDRYTAARSGTITWHPTFTFHGFRYVELTGLPQGATPEPGWVTGVVLHSDFPSAGRFTSSHDLLNRLQQNIRWGQRGNYLDIPTDCPQRNERLGWTGDAQVFGPTSLFNYDVHSFWKSWLQSVREEQRENGLVCHVVPDTGCGQGSPGWGDVAVVSPWDVYVRTGDRGVLEENYEMMTRWTAAYERDAHGFIVSRKGFGDWLVPYGKGTGHDYVSTAYFGRCARVLHLAASVLGRAEDSARYAELHRDIRAAVSRTFFDDTGKLHKETQTGYLMMLGYDLVEPGLRPGAVKNLVRLIDEAGGHLGTGFLGTPLIALVLDQEGHSDLAAAVVFKETYPSWFYSIHQGATTMWERWNSYSHDKGFGNAGMNSFNHYAYGAIGQWMYERVAGLAPDPARPGYKHFFVQPRPAGPLTHAEAELETMYGTAASGWKRTDGGLVVTASVPPNTTATFVVPELGEHAPVVSESGTRCALRRQDGKVLMDLRPGQYAFVVN